MGAVLFRVRSALRRRLVSTTFVTLIVALVSGLVIALAAGAQRTSTAPDRYESQSSTVFDALVTQDTSSAPRTDDVRALPGVESVDSVTFVFGGLVDASGVPDHDYSDALVFSGSARPVGLHIVRGREPDRNNPNEFVASRTFVEQHGAAIGDEFELVTLTQDQIELEGFSSDPQGPRLTVTLVGIIDGPGQLDDSSTLVVVSPALLNNTEIGVALTLMAVDLQPGVDVGMLRDQVDSFDDREAFSVEPGALISAEVRRAVQVQARGLWLLALAAAVAAIATLGQLIARQVRPTQSERERLAAIGFTNGQVLAEGAGRALIPIVIGAVIGTFAAILPSGEFPLGFAAIIEPKPGIAAPLSVHIGGAALLIFALALWVLLSLQLSRARNRAIVGSAALPAIATRIPSVTASTGMRFALQRGERNRGSVGGSFAGVALAVAGVAGAITFGASLDRLISQPFRYGSNYDVALGDDGSEELPEGFVDLLNEHPDVESLVLFAGTDARAGDATVTVLGMDVLRGAGTPYVVDGRLPAGADEIALGQVTADDLGVDVGEQLSLVGATNAATYHVTGLIVVPGFGANDGLGDGGLVTMEGLALIDDTAQPLQIALQVAKDLETFFASRPELAAIPPEENFKPGAVLNLQRIQAIPYVLAAVLATLALLTVGHVLMISLRSSRRDRAVLRALGADRGWIRRVVHWHATVFTAVPLITGIAIGIVAGRLIFSTFATNLGAVSDAAVPFVMIIVGAAMALTVANAIVSLPARNAVHLGQASLLRTE